VFLVTLESVILFTQKKKKEEERKCYSENNIFGPQGVA